LRAEAAEFGFQRLAFGFPAAGRDDLCPVFGKGERGGSADAGQSASDQDDWVAHFVILAIYCPTGGVWIAPAGS
jgi:hypothetical protein